MFKMICVSEPSGDCCYMYDVRYDKPCVVGDVINYILSRGEWGSINVDGYNVDYQGDKINSTIPNETLSKRVLKIRAYGGWFMMNFYIKT